MSFLKPKYLDITIDNLPDTSDTKAVNSGAQTIEGQKTFSRAPRIASMPVEWNERNLVVRKLVSYAEEYMEINSAKILPLKVTAESLLMNAFAIPDGITYIPYYVVYGGKKYTTGGENPTAKVIEKNCKRYILILTKPVNQGDDCVTFQSYDNWWGIPYMG